MRIGTQELLLILLIVLVIFGPTQIPKLSKMFGKSMKSFKQGVSGEEAEADKAGTVKKSSGDKESDE
ncbi:putative Sec-independent protein translocase protein TatA [Oscillibacter valericigenes Sjm18-20]|nr:putative Sec-independent protein translocase protein TatA [Oscillibacter valericigenes Sjm18-20]